MSESDTPRTRKHLHYTCDISMTEANLLIDYMNREENARAEFIAERDEALRELAEARKDAARYRWLVEDHDDAAMRARVRLVAGSIAISGKGYTDAAIDAAMAADPPAK